MQDRRKEGQMAEESSFKYNDLRFPENIIHQLELLVGKEVSSIIQQNNLGGIKI